MSPANVARAASERNLAAAILALPATVFDFADFAIETLRNLSIAERAASANRIRRNTL